MNRDEHNSNPDKSQRWFPLSEEDEEFAKGQAGKLLRLFKKHRLQTTSTLCENISHRFSTSIQHLRDHGHDIDTRPGEGRGFVFEYIGQNDKVKATKTWQDKYYACSHWRNLRLERLKYDDFKCCQCKSKSELHVHHWQYELFNENLRDLITLCKDCHTRLHKYNGVKVKFPRSVHRDIAERIVV